MNKIVTFHWGSSLQFPRRQTTKLNLSSSRQTTKLTGLYRPSFNTQQISVLNDEAPVLKYVEYQQRTISNWKYKSLDAFCASQDSNEGIHQQKIREI